MVQIDRGSSLALVEPLPPVGPRWVAWIFHGFCLRIGEGEDPRGSPRNYRGLPRGQGHRGLARGKLREDPRYVARGTTRPVRLSLLWNASGAVRVMTSALRGRGCAMIAGCALVVQVGQLNVILESMSLNTKVIACTSTIPNSKHERERGRC